MERSFFIVPTENQEEAKIAALRKNNGTLIPSQEDFRILIEEASDGIFIADATGQFTDINNAGIKMLGYSRSEILEKTILDLVSPDEVSRFKIRKAALFQAGNIEISEWKAKRKDGSFLPVEVSSKVLSDGRWLTLLRDISIRKKWESKRDFFINSSSSISETIDYQDR